MNEDAAFTPVGNTTAVDSTGNKVTVIVDPLRYLRWSLINMSGTTQFMIDAIARP